MKRVNRSLPPYLLSSHLLKEIELSRPLGQPTPALAKAFILLTDRLATSPCFRGYSFIDEMKGRARLNLCKVWNRYSPERGTPFSFFTAVASREFLDVIKAEKKQQAIRQELRSSMGLSDE